MVVTSDSGLQNTKIQSWSPAVSPALFMAAFIPLRAHRRLPPNGTYCWLSGRDSVFRSCRRCFSLRMECTAFRKSFLLSGELRIKTQEYKHVYWLKVRCGLASVYTCVRILLAAQLEGPLRSPFRFRSCVNYLTHGCPLRVWERERRHMWARFKK